MGLQYALHKLGKLRDTVLQVSETKPYYEESNTFRNIPQKEFYKPTLAEKDFYTVNGFVPQMRLRTGSKYIWRIDAGHGAETKGKRSAWFYSLIHRKWVQFIEYVSNQSIKEFLFSLLEADGRIDYVELVPDHKHVGNIVSERVVRLNQSYTKRDRGISIHSNAGPLKKGQDWVHPSIEGIEVWHFKNSRIGTPMAKSALKHLTQEFPNWRNRGLKVVPDDKRLFIVWKSRLPMVLVEIGFFNNLKQVKELITKRVQKRAAVALYKFILEQENLPPVLQGL